MSEINNDLLGINNPYTNLLPQAIDNNLIRDTSPEGLHRAYRLGYVNGIILPESAPYPYNKFAQYNLDFLANNQEDGEPLIFEDTKYYSMINGAGTGKRILNQTNYMKIDPTKALKGAQVTGDSFIGDTMVLMADGSEKAIKDVCIGDEVKTPQGNIKAVIDINNYKYTGKLHSIKTKDYTRWVSATPDHQFITFPDSTLDVILWKPISDIKIYTNVLIPHGNQSKENTLSGNAILKLGLGLSASIDEIKYEEVTEIDVYCLTIYSDHAFIANGYAVANCVSHAIRAALDELRCNRIFSGKLEAYVKRQATCGIYSGRGHTGQGADPVGLSAWAMKIGTMLEQVYDTGSNKYDFTEYSKYVNWGMSRGRVGVPDDLLKLTQPYTAGTYKVVNTTNALLDLLASGGTAHIGSNMGVSSFGDPISKLSGSWAHDMNINGVDDTDWCKQKYGSRIWFIDQSWGPGWNTVNNIPEEWKPWSEGAMAITDASLSRHINSGGTVVFFDGKFFDASPIDNMLI